MLKIMTVIHIILDKFCEFNIHMKFDKTVLLKYFDDGDIYILHSPLLCRCNMRAKNAHASTITNVGIWHDVATWRRHSSCSLQS